MRDFLYRLLVASNATMRYFFQVVPMVALVGLLYLVISLLRCRKTGNRFSKQVIINFLFVCYLTGLISLILVPNHFWTAIWFYLFNGFPGCEIGPMFVMNFNLVQTVVYYIQGTVVLGEWVKQMLILNLLMFLPMGILLPLVSSKINKKTIIIVAVAISIVVELLQPIIGRSFDMDDVIMNSLGIICGWGLVALARRFQKGMNRRVTS